MQIYLLTLSRGEELLVLNLSTRRLVNDHDHELGWHANTVEIGDPAQHHKLVRHHFLLSLAIFELKVNKA